MQRIIELPDRRRPKRKPKPTPRTPILIRATDAARRLGVDRSTIYDLIKRQDIVGYKVGGAVQVDEASLLGYLEARRIGGAS